VPDRFPKPGSSILGSVRVGGTAADVFVFQGGGPAGQEAQPIVGWGTGRGGEGVQVPAGVGGQVKSLVGQLEPGELTAIDALDTGLRGGPDPELLNTRTFPKTVDNS